MPDFNNLALYDLNPLTTPIHLGLNLHYLIQHNLPYVIETLHICLFRLILLEREFCFDLCECPIEPLLVLFKPSLISLIQLAEVFFEVFELVTHCFLVRHQMLQSLRQRDLDLHSNMPFQEVIVDFGLQELYSLGDSTVSHYVLDRFLHA